jgi:hypothetical protein
MGLRRSRNGRRRAVATRKARRSEGHGSSDAMGLRRSLRGFLDALPARPLPPQLCHAPAGVWSAPDCRHVLGRLFGS